MNTQDITIRPADSEDAAVLAELASRTFLDTYGPFNSLENLNSYTQKHHGIKTLANELTSKGIHYFLAFTHTTPIGYIKLRNHSHPGEIAHLRPMELERIYVSAGFKNRGAGSLLLTKALDYARENNYATLWLGVWEHNSPAFEFYMKHGFEKFGEQNFLLGDDLQNDWLMRKTL